MGVTGEGRKGEGSKGKMYSAIKTKQIKKKPETKVKDERKEQTLSLERDKHIWRIKRNALLGQQEDRS